MKLEVKPSKSYLFFSDFFGTINAFLVESIEAISVAFFFCLVLFLFFITPHEVYGSSMRPTFVNGEFLIANKFEYYFSTPDRGDVVIFEFSPSQDYIKRVIGLPGDEILLRDGRFIVNGTPLNEQSYLSDTIYTKGSASLSEGESLKIPEGEYFVVGDNRGDSADSRYFGTIEEGKVKGKAWLVYFPFSAMRVVNSPDY